MADIEKVKTGFEEILGGIADIEEGMKGLNIPKDAVILVTDLVTSTGASLAAAKEAIESYYKQQLDAMAGVKESEVNTVIDKLLNE